jgi:HNH endonuclease
MAAQKSRRPKPAPIHPTIKERLGYAAGKSDSDVLRDWKARLRRVCKPCWELKYCPYGPLVEQPPTLPSRRDEAAEHNASLQDALHSGFNGEIKKLSDEDRELYEQWVSDDELVLRQAAHEIWDLQRLDEIAKLPTAEERLREFLGGTLPPIHIYRVPFEPIVNDPNPNEIPPEIWLQVKTKAAELKAKYSDALKNGVVDDRRPLHPVRRLWLEHLVSRDEESLPEEIPDTFAEAECNIFGHICPVFFAAEATTETSSERRRGRYISFATKMRVVRRDNHTCQHCSKHLRDDEVEFDHIIPVAKGGSSEEHNLRLTCFDCNRDKRDEYVP